MGKVVNFIDSYKDEILKFGTSGLVIAKDPSFNLANEIGFFVSSNKVKKGDYTFYVCLDNRNLPIGAISVSVTGKVLIFTVDKNYKEEAISLLIKKLNTLLEGEKHKTISARVDPKYILDFNNEHFKSIKCFESDPTEFKFLVEKSN